MEINTWHHYRGSWEAWCARCGKWFAMGTYYTWPSSEPPSILRLLGGHWEWERGAGGKENG